MNELLRKIEALRDNLKDLVNSKEATDQEVIIASQMLDVLLNEYYRLLKQKTQNT